MSTAPSGLVSPNTPSGSPAASEASTPPPPPPPPPARLPDTIPTFITPSAPTVIPPVCEHVIAVLMKMTSSTEEGQNMRAWVLYHSLTSLEDFLMWELDTLQYDAITIWHLIMLRKYIHHLVQDSHLSVASDASDHVLESSNFLHTTFHQFMSRMNVWRLMMATLVKTQS